MYFLVPVTMASISPAFKAIVKKQVRRFNVDGAGAASLLQEACWLEISGRYSK
jgi:hypothetical protein